MKPGPRPAIQMEKQLGGTESLGISKVGQTVLVRLMESQICHQLAVSVALWGEGSEKGQWAFPAFLSWRKLFPRSCLDARHFIFSLDDTGIFQAATLVLEL